MQTMSLLPEQSPGSDLTDVRLQRRLAMAAPTKTRDTMSEKAVRCLRTAAFLCICSAGLGQAVAPWLLSAAEAAAALCIYYLGFTDTVLWNKSLQHLNFHFDANVEDVVALSLLRSFILMLAYSSGTGRYCQRPYLILAWFFAACYLPFLVAKLCLFKFAADDFVAPLLLLLSFFCFTVLHIGAAQGAHHAAKRRNAMGLTGFGYPWEEGERAWMMMGRGTQHARQHHSTTDDMDDVPAHQLADPDSSFLAVDGLLLHYKEYGGESGSDDVGVVLMHGFGGGAFSWRHIAPRLSRTCGCRVLAFDRPAFGLTERASKEELGWNPYTLEGNTQLLLRFCQAVGLRRMSIIAHADAALVALHAAAVLSRVRRDSKAQQVMKADSRGSNGSNGGGMRWLRTPWKARSACSDDDALRSPLLATDVAVTHSCPEISSRTPRASTNKSHAHGFAPLKRVLESDVAAVCSSASLSSDANDASVPCTPVHSRQAEPPSTQQQHRQQPHNAVDLCHESANIEHLASPFESAATSPLTVSHSEPSPASRPPPAAAIIGGETATYAVSSSNIGGDVIIDVGSFSLQVDAMVLLHPVMDEQSAPSLSLTRVLASSRVGKSILRPLLRSEVGEVTNRRAWHDESKLTHEVCEMYKMPLHVRGWDDALLEAVKHARPPSRRKLREMCAAVQHIPTLIVTGAQDRLVPPARTAAATKLLPQCRTAVVPQCGHLSMEEDSETLLDLVAPFISSALQSTRTS